MTSVCDPGARRACGVSRPSGPGEQRVDRAVGLKLGDERSSSSGAAPGTFVDCRPLSKTRNAPLFGD